MQTLRSQSLSSWSDGPQTSPALSTPRSSTALRLARRAVMERLGKLGQGRLTVIEGSSRTVFGSALGSCPIDIELEIHDPRVWLQIALAGTVGAGEAYIQGRWRCSDLTALARLMIIERSVMEELDSKGARFVRPLLRLGHWLHANTRRGSERNIAAHYDLGNDFFAEVLDPGMTYSCALFESAEATLEEAQTAKYDRLCRKLALSPDDHLVEIGTGWGGLALHAARHYGCRVTTTTISRQQHAWAEGRIRAQGLQDRIELLFRDYRELEGGYDKLVSIEMIEAVGLSELPTYFDRLGKLLRPHGMAAVQAIVIEDRLYEQARRSVDFIQRFVFPGSGIPSIGSMTQAAAGSSDLRLYHLEDITRHYPPTLRAWNERLAASAERLEHRGYGAALLRLFEFYLCYCEAGFLERAIGDVQMVFTKPQARPPELLGDLSRTANGPA